MFTTEIGTPCEPWNLNAPFDGFASKRALVTGPLMNSATQRRRSCSRRECRSRLFPPPRPFNYPNDS